MFSHSNKNQGFDELEISVIYIEDTPNYHKTLENALKHLLYGFVTNLVSCHNFG